MSRVILYLWNIIFFSNNKHRNTSSIDRAGQLFPTSHPHPFKGEHEYEMSQPIIYGQNLFNHNNPPYYMTDKPSARQHLYLTFLHFTFLGFQAFVIGICSASILVVRKYAGAGRK